VESLSIPTNITVFERSSYIGGRSTTVNAYDLPSEPVELGASIFVEVNKNLYSAAKEFGLSLKSASEERSQETDPVLGVWDGREFVFTQSTGGYYWWNVAKLLWKYGLAPIRTQNLMKATVGKFLKMYEAPAFPFASLTEVAFEMGLLEATTVRGVDFLEANNIAERFSQEIIQASTRVNYGQNLYSIHGLETMVCMATDGAVAVEGGNWQIFARMLIASKAHVQLNSSVTQIHRNENKTYTVTVSSQNSSEEASSSDLFDTVILAAPLQYSSLSISPSPSHIPDKIPYVELHVTLFASPHKLSPRFFGLTPPARTPEIVITTLPKDYPPPENPEEGVGPAGFWSISTLGRITNPHTKGKEYLYKIFSPKPLDSGFMSAILGLGLLDSEAEDSLAGISKDDISWIHEKVWHSYPYLYPRVTFEPLLLDEDEKDENQGGLWYTSGIESMISTMETSSLMGANVAALIAQGWAKDISNTEEVVLESFSEEMEL
jgi:prenylcysteine oxidase/farnesylcysteine lyase